jgi:hypothetical protein
VPCQVTAGFTFLSGNVQYDKELEQTKRELMGLSYGQDIVEFIQYLWDYHMGRIL